MGGHALRIQRSSHGDKLSAVDNDSPVRGVISLSRNCDLELDVFVISPGAGNRRWDSAVKAPSHSSSLLLVGKFLYGLACLPNSCIKLRHCIPPTVNWPSIPDIAFFFHPLNNFPKKNVRLIASEARIMSNHLALK
jgi:hypothetical protein